LVVVAGKGAVVLGKVVRDHRRRLGPTQDELAAKAGLSARHIRHIEAGRIASPRPQTVRLLADAFGLNGSERDRFFESAAGGGESGPAGGVVQAFPAQLPLDVRGFTGRRGELDRLNALLEEVWGEHQPTAVVISAVWGTAGVGKTDPGTWRTAYRGNSGIRAGRCTARTGAPETCDLEGVRPTQAPRSTGKYS
jgi:transcriptional regulator with XRE-family HTH domain